MLGLVELLLHFAVPFAMFSQFRRVREALMLGAVALLPDLDVLLHVHRSLTHSLVVVGLVGLGVFVVVRGVRPTYSWLVVLGTLSLVSHVVLDVFGGATPVLWPVLGSSVALALDGSVTIGSLPGFSLVGEVTLVEPCFLPFSSLDAPVFTSEGLVVAVLLMLPGLVRVAGSVDWRGLFSSR